MLSPVLTLYSRTGCHLCEEMQDALNKLQQRYSFSFNIINIDTDKQLKQRYNEWIPLLAAGEQEICHYYLDQNALLAYLDV
ncbi:MAG: glutaredoxin family protein [Thiomargarita sp.]|nr:glutaredoxin family protein [Thiomargarita sp.]